MKQAQPGITSVFSEDYPPVHIANEEVDAFQKTHHARLTDTYQEIIEELFRVDNPAVSPRDEGAYAARLAEYATDYLGGVLSRDHGQWFYYPWLNTLVHVPSDEDYYRLRSARNRNLITTAEQQKLKKLKVGISGLSVGSSAAAALAHIGVRHFKLADADTLALSNLNRLRSGVHNLGVKKTTITMRNIYELDPYANVEVFEEGVNVANLESFVAGLDVLIDEMDDIAMKTRLRLLAKKKKLPVLMATDNGDNVLVDIERFDEDATLPVFHGLLTEAEVKTILDGNVSPQEFMKYALKVIDPRHAPVRLLGSVPLIGRELAGIPQLGSSAMMAGGIIAYVVREIAAGSSLKHGKHHINLEGLLRADYPQLEEQQKQLLMMLMKSYA